MSYETELAALNIAVQALTDTVTALDTTTTNGYNSAVIAATAQAASVLTMDKRYLGAFAVAPTLDNQGAALSTGAVYYDTALAKVRIWSGSAWVEGIASVAGVSTVNGANGAVTVQATLVSGTNIKTLDGVSLLGSGNISIASPGSSLYLAQFSSL